MSYNEYDINRQYPYYYDHYTTCFQYNDWLWDCDYDSYKACTRVQLKPYEETLNCCFSLNADTFPYLAKEYNDYYNNYCSTSLDYILILLAFCLLPIPWFC